jgi:chromosomal replication initiation ATPase DnaA
LGDAPFVEKIHRNLDLEPTGPLKVDLSAIEAAVLQRYKFPVQVLYSRTKDRRGSFGRAVVAYLGQALGSITLNEVARRYGRDQVTLSLGIKRLRERLVQESDMSENIAILLKRIRDSRARIK